MKDVENIEDVPIEEDGNIPNPIFNFMCAIDCMVPMYFLDEMVAEGFTYELSNNRKFRSNHLLDKELCADYMLMRSKFYHKNHCILLIISDPEDEYTFFVIYAKRKHAKAIKFHYKTIRIKCGPNMSFNELHNVLSMRELSRKETSVYNSFLQEIIGSLYDPGSLEWLFALKY